MKKYKSGFIPNKKELHRAAAHSRALRAKSPNQFDCYFNINTGEFHYLEYVGVAGSTYYAEKELIYVPAYLGTAEEYYRANAQTIEQTQNCIRFIIDNL